MNEQELVKRCIKKDRIAQELLYTSYADGLFRLAFRYLKDTVEAEDVLIIALNKVFDKMHSFSYSGKGSLGAWIRKIVVNEALMALRKKHNFHLTESLDENTPEPDLQLASEADGEAITLAINELPLGYRTVFNLFVVEGYNHEEIAEMLDINIGTSRSQLFKAKALLQKTLTVKGVEYGT